MERRGIMTIVLQGFRGVGEEHVRSGTDGTVRRHVGAWGCAEGEGRCLQAEEVKMYGFGMKVVP